MREFEGDGVILAAVNLPPALVARSLPLDGDLLGAVMDDYRCMVTAGVLVEDTTEGVVRTVRKLPVPVYNLADADVARVTDAVRRLARLLLAAGARAVYLPWPTRNGPVRKMADLDRLTSRAAGDLELFTVQLMGTAAMGGDPVRPVCDPLGRVRDAASLYVADASLFPSSLGVNPMETVAMLSSRFAGRHRRPQDRSLVTTGT